MILALLYGKGDFYKTGQYAMALGYDADCNAATACAVVGVRVGFSTIEKLPSFHMPDRYVNLTRPQLPKECKISDQVDLMMRLCEKLILANHGETIKINGKDGYRIRLQAPRIWSRCRLKLSVAEKVPQTERIGRHDASRMPVCGLWSAQPAFRAATNR